MGLGLLQPRPDERRRAGAGERRGPTRAETHARRGAPTATPGLPPVRSKQDPILTNDAEDQETPAGRPASPPPDGAAPEHLQLCADGMLG